MERGKLIVFDGGDAVGKKTQSDKLSTRLISEKIPLVTYSFPQYENYFGIMVRQYLNGEFGNPVNIDPRIASLIYALDRQQASPDIKQHLESGTNVLCNRYIESNMGFQSAKIDDERERSKFLEWLLHTEHGELGVPRSDLVMYLYMPLEESEKLLEKRGEVRDGHESDRNFQKKVVEAYMELANRYDHWNLINCSAGNGSIRTIDDIHEEVYKIVKNSLD